MSDTIIEKTSAGGVLYHRGKYLVIAWPSQQTVELPKGTVEPGETVEITCVREMREETGYNVRIVAPLHTAEFTVTWDDGKTYHKTVHYYLMRRTDDEAPQPAREANEDFENLWLDYDAALERLDYNDMRQALRRAREIIDSGDYS